MCPERIVLEPRVLSAFQAGEAQVRADKALKEAGKTNTPVFEAKDLESITGKYHTGEYMLSHSRIVFDFNWRLRAAMHM